MEEQRKRIRISRKAFSEIHSRIYVTAFYAEDGKEYVNQLTDTLKRYLDGDTGAMPEDPAYNSAWIMLRFTVWEAAARSHRACESAARRKAKAAQQAEEILPTTEQAVELKAEEVPAVETIRPIVYIRPLPAKETADRRRTRFTNRSIHTDNKRKYAMSLP